MPRLVISQGPGKGNCYEIKGKTSLGRDRSNRIQLLNKSVSRNHAVIVEENNKFVINDLKSKNGVLVNNQKVTQHSLKKGDQITIGKIELVYEPDFQIKTLPGQKGGLFIMPEGEVAIPPASKAPLETTMPLPAVRRDEATSLIEETKTVRIKRPKEAKKDESALVKTLNRRLNALYEINQVINSYPGEDVLDKVMETILDIFEVERGAIIFCNESGKNPYPVLIKSRKGTSGDIPLSKTILKEVVQNRQAILSSDIGVDQRFLLSQSLRFDEVKSILCAPLISKNKLIGLIYLDTRGYLHAFEEEDLKLIIAISHQLAIIIENIRLSRQMQEEVKEFRKMIHEELNLIGQAPQIITLLDKVRKVAPSDTTILITGETGTGKELIARAIHYQSLRRHKPFITVDCSAIPQGLLESELFGHEKGAFTGADRAKPGRFELAQGGTLFLDEIGNLDLTTQTKFLRAVEEKEFTRVGSLKLISADVRIITATNQDLEALIHQGRFREDLFYRLAVVTFSLPSLRERSSDIPLLAKHFLKKFVVDAGRNITDITPETMDLLVKYSWPGNVRELRNVIERSVVLCEKSTITPEDLPANITGAMIESGLRDRLNIGPSSLSELTRQIEKEYILKILETTKGKKVKAAQLLKISRPTLDKKLKEYGIE